MRPSPHIGTAFAARVVDTLRPGEPEAWLVERRSELAGEPLEPDAARSIGGTVLLPAETPVG